MFPTYEYKLLLIALYLYFYGHMQGRDQIGQPSVLPHPIKSSSYVEGWESLCSRVLGTSLLENRKYWFLGFRFPGFKDYWFLGFKVCWFLGSNIPKIFDVCWKILAPYYQMFPFMFSGRYCSHVPDFREFIRRIGGIVGSHLFHFFVKLLFQGFEFSIDNIFQKRVGISWIVLAILVSPKIK